MLFLNRIMAAIFTMTQSALANISQFVKQNTLEESDVVSNAGQELYDCSQSLLRLVTNFEMTSIATLENLKLVNLTNCQFFNILDFR
jgi:hypothetical protein